MAETLTTTLTQIPADIALRPRISGDSFSALTIKYRAGELIGIASDHPDHDVTTFVPGISFIDGAYISETGLPTVTTAAGFDTGTATISGGTIGIVDIDGDPFADKNADKLLNNRALMNSVLSLYIWPVGEAIDFERDLVMTSQINDDSWDAGESVLSFSDINRQTDVKIFKPASWHMLRNFSDADEWLPITMTQAEYDDQQFTFEHSAAYSVDPSLTVGYLLIDDQILTHTGLVYDATRDEVGFNIINWSAFQTEARDWEVDQNTELQNRQEIKEFIYWQEDVSNTIKMIYEGSTHDGRAVLPHWTASIPVDFIDLNSLALFASPERRVIQQPKEQSAKRFIENEILRFSVAVLTIDKKGRLSYVPAVTDGTVTGFELELNETNTDISAMSPLRRDTSKVKTSVGIEWGYQPLKDTYRRPTFYIDPSAADRNQNNESVIFSSKTIQSGFYTESAVLRLAQAMHARHADPSEGITVSPDFELLWVPEGTQIRLNFEDVITYDRGVASSGPLDADFTLISKTIDYENQNLTFQLKQYRSRGDDLFAEAEPQLTDEFFIRGRHSFADLPGLTISSGVASGSPDIDINDAYYYLDNLTLSNQFTPNWINGPGAGLKLAVKGVLLIGADMNGTGQGLSRGGLGETDSAAATAGQRGYFGTPAAGGSFEIHDRETDFGPRRRLRMLSRPPKLQQPKGQVSRHVLRLTFDGQNLQGLPPHPCGSGGGGSDRSLIVYDDKIGDSTYTTTETYYDGHDGAAGGMGFEFICYPGSDFLPGGKITTDGADAEDGIEITGLLNSGGNSAVATSSGGNPYPGVLSFVIDGAGTTPDINETNFSAKIGGGITPGVPAPAIDYKPHDTTIALPLTHSHFTSPSGVNLWEAAHAIAFVPRLEVAQVEPTTEFQQELILNPDRRVVLFVQDNEPSDKNNRDLWITVSQFNSDSKTPTMQRWNSSLVDWQLVAWPDSVAFMLLQVERTYGAGDGSVLHFGDAFPDDYSVDDLFYNDSTEELYRLGPPHVLLNRQVYGYYTAHNYFADGNLLGWLAGDSTLYFGTDRSIRPTNNFTPPPPGPGESNDPFTVLLAATRTYDLDGDVEWTYGTDNAVSVDAGGSGDAVIFIQSGTGGMASDTDNRQIWVYVKASGSGKVIKIQSAGDASNTGDPAVQATHTILNTGSDYVWEKVTGGIGQFNAFASELQIRTDDVGVDICKVILLDKDSTSVPVGAAGLSTPAGSGEVARLSYPKQNIVDLNNPYPGFTITELLGEGGTPGMRIDAAGTGVYRWFAERFTFAVSPGKQYVITSKVKSHLTVINSAAEGYAVMLECYDTSGNLRLTNDVETAGSDHWFSQQRGEFTYVTEILDIPWNHPGIVSMSARPVVHADGGYLLWDSIECKESTDRYRLQTVFSSTQLNVFTTIFLDGSSPPATGLSTSSPRTIEKWSTYIARRRVVKFSFSAVISTDQYSAKGKLVFAINQTLGGATILLSEEYTIDPSGTFVQFTSDTVTSANDTFDELIMGYFFTSESAVNVPNDVIIESIRYKVSHDELPRAGW